MEEIKLKAWSYILGKMSGTMKLREIHGLKIIQWENIKWLKSACMNDVNGDEIFEGDILAYSRKEKQNDKIVSIVSEKGFEVVYKSGCFLLNNEPLGYDFDEGKFVECDTKNWATIIGNIYANPELLTE